MKQGTKSLRVVIATLIAFLFVLGLGTFFPSFSGNYKGTIASAAEPEWETTFDGFQTVAENVTKSTMAGINGRNVSRLANTLILYTDLNTNTGTNEWGTVVVCEPDPTTGNYKITAKDTNGTIAKNTAIPVGGFVLSQNGADRSTGGIITWAVDDEIILHDITKGSIKSTELRNTSGNHGQIKGEIEITHVNVNYLWGNANILFTEAYGPKAPAKNNHTYFVFSPVADSNGLFKVTGIIASAASASEVAIPAGGFVVVIHDGRSGVDLQGDISAHRATVPVDTICEISGLTELGFNADLENITIDGDGIDGFSVNKRDYLVILPDGTTTVPAVVAVAADEEADVEVNAPESLPGAAVEIIVTSKNEKIVKTYTVFFSVGSATVTGEAAVEAHGTVTGSKSYYMGTKASLKAIPTKNKYVFKEWQVDGESVSTANPYIFTVEEDVTVKAVFEALKADSYVVTAQNKTKGEFVEISYKNYDRKANTLVWYTDINETTGTNEWGNVVVVDADGKVSAFHASGTAGAKNTAIPEGGYVLTGAGAAADTKGWNLSDWAVDDEIVIHDNSFGHVTGGTARKGQFGVEGSALKVDIRITEKNLVPAGAGGDANHANKTIIYTRAYGVASPALPWSSVWVFTPEGDNYKLTEVAAASANGVSKNIPNGGFVLVVHDGTATELSEAGGLALHFMADDICTVSGEVFPAGSKNATISGIKVNGTDLVGFAAATKSYTVELPAGTVEVPTITATAADGGSLVIVPAANMSGKATVFAVSANGLFVSEVYEISFTVVAKAALQETYDSYKTKVEADYTKATWDVFKAELDAAKAVLDKADATQAEVDAANTALIEAAAQLADAPPAKKGCSSTTVSASSAVMMLLVLAALFVLTRKKKQNDLSQ